MTGAHWSAPRVRTKRSTVSGRSATDGTHRQPSISAGPGLTTKTPSRGKPFLRTFVRMRWPMFIFSETPMMPIVAGRSNAPDVLDGTADDGLLVPRESADAVEGHEPVPRRRRTG